MTASAEIDTPIAGFLAGKLAFAELVKKLRERSTASGSDLVVERLREYVNIGRLPQDLAALILMDVVPNASAGFSAVDDSDDDPTVPLIAERFVQPMALPSVSADPIREKVDEVVLSALVSDFKGLRDRRAVAAEGAPDRDLDAALSGFRGARLRRDAVKADQQEPRRFDLAPSATDGSDRVPAIGEMLKGRFVLDQELGRGGMGVVFRAVDRRRLEAMHAHPYVAIKLLGGDFRRRPDALRALEAEARKAQELAHPNIVTVYDFDREGRNVFLVMELLKGEPLDQHIKSMPAGLGFAAAQPLVEEICAGLAHAHTRGVVHSDVKPANIFLSEEGKVKVLDFGIASAMRGADVDADWLAGYTPTYASPEALRGEPRDPRNDVFAIGAIAYELITGRHPFDRKPALTALTEKLRPQRSADVPGPAWRAIEKALSFERTDRPADAGEFAKAFTSRASRLTFWKR